MHVFFLNTSKHSSAGEEFPGTLKNVSFTAKHINTTIRFLPAICSLLFSSTPYTVSRFINPDTRKTVKSLVRESTFDIVQIEGLAMVPYAGLLSAPPQSLLIFRPHNAEHMIWQKIARTEKNPLKKVYYHLLAHQILRYEKKTARRFPAILPISPDDTSLFRKWNPFARILTIPFGVDIPEENQLSSTGTIPVILFLGALDWEPNIRGLTWFLTDIWPLLKEKIPELRIRIAGRNPRKELVRFIQNIQSSKDFRDIEFLGEIAATDAFFRSGSVFIVPLQAGGGIRIKILEAMARGLAVVSTTTGAAGIPVTHKENILLADQPADFAAATEKLLKNPRFCRKITGNALLLLRKDFNRKKIIENLENFYRSL